MDYQYRNKLYGGFAGKYIGVMHGAEIEGWTYEKIRDVYGIIKEYPVKFDNFCSDDDLNGPVFYMRALLDFERNEDIPVECMAHTLLNYVGERHGFFWWGGYGISTEETAYWNLVNGIPAPMSGSIEQNGIEMAEQIGGQIFSDCWGLLCPGRPDLAAKLAGKMSSVSHGGNGVYGGQFIAACIAGAFTASSVEEIIEAGILQIPEDCEYAVMVKEVMEVSLRNEDRFIDTFYFVKKKYGYDSYGGVCHIIPNAAIIILSLIHGRGNFTETLNICNMCGWDTDCNVGNIGTIMGVFTGADHIPDQWMEPVTDFLCASSVMGSLNIQTLSQAALIAAKITHRLLNWDIEDYDKVLFGKKEGKHFHFEFPGAFHGLRIRGGKKNNIIMKNTDEASFEGKRSLKIAAPFLQKGESFQLYYKSYYVPEDFMDSRYDPDFSPTIYPGDKISVRIHIGSGHSPLHLIPFVKERLTGNIKRLEEEAICWEQGGSYEDQLTGRKNKWKQITFQVPFTENAIIEEIGWEFHCPAAKCEETFYLYLDDVEIEARPFYRMEFSRLLLEKWNTVHTSVAHMTWLRGRVELEKGLLAISGYGEPAESYTGDISWTNYRFKSFMIPRKGDCHRILFRVQGAMRSYGAGFTSGQKLCLWKKEQTFQKLEEVDFLWKNGQEYEIEIMAYQNVYTVKVNGKIYIEFKDAKQPYLHGAIGFGNTNSARTFFREYEIQTIYP